MNPIYTLSLEELRRLSGAEIRLAETDTDLYYLMALSLHRTIHHQIQAGKTTALILPVGPVFQYRRFITLLEIYPLDLSDVHLFFMDEYLEGDGNTLIDPEHPLSFRGFIQRELIDPLAGRFHFHPRQIYFPDPACPETYDRKIDDLGGIDLCQAGVGIAGHLAFNEPIAGDKISLEDFKKLPTRVVELTRETITINSNTALGGAFDEIPPRAVTVGMAPLLASRRFEIYMNRPWQKAVLRKALMLSPTPEFPVTCAAGHPDLSFTVTPEAAAVPDFALK